MSRVITSVTTVGISLPSYVVASVLVVVTVAATLTPALRAARVDPVEVLRAL